MILIGAGSADRDVPAVDRKLSLAEQSAAFSLVVTRNLLAQLDGELRLVPAADLDSTVVFRGYRQRLVGNRLCFFVAHIGAEVIVVHVQMIRAVVTELVIVHGDVGCARPLV